MTVRVIRWKIIFHRKLSGSISIHETQAAALHRGREFFELCGNLLHVKQSSKAERSPSSAKYIFLKMKATVHIQNIR